MWDELRCERERERGESICKWAEREWSITGAYSRSKECAGADLGEQREHLREADARRGDGHELLEAARLVELLDAEEEVRAHRRVRVRLGTGARLDRVRGRLAVVPPQVVLEELHAARVRRHEHLQQLVVALEAVRREQVDEQQNVEVHEIAPEARVQRRVELDVLLEVRSELGVAAALVQLQHICSRAKYSKLKMLKIFYTH